MAIEYPKPIAVTPVPNVRYREFTKCGQKPLAGGRIWTYEANSTTPKVTYKDPYGITPNTNPIILDAAGEADIYLNGTYRFVVEDKTGVIQKDVAKIGSWYSGDLDDQMKSVNDLLETSAQTLMQPLQDAINTALAAGAGEAGWTAALIEYKGGTQDGFNENQEKINDAVKNITLNIDNFKTVTNSDADAFYDMVAYARFNGIKHLNINRNIELDRKITLIQDEARTLDDMTLNFTGNVHYVGDGQGGDLYSGIIEIFGLLSDKTTTALGEHAEYTSNLNVVDSTKFKTGDYIYVQSTAQTKPDIYLKHLVRIDSINDFTLTTDTIRRLHIRPSVAQVNVTKVYDVNGFNINGLPLFTANNQISRENGIGAVQLKFCTNSNISIKCKGLWFKGIATNQCSKINAYCIGSEPAATGGGEGYCIQFQFTTHSKAKAIGNNMRHSTDMTSSWWCEINDSLDFSATNTAFIHHCAYEYKITYNNCLSFGSLEHGFNFGIVSGAYGDHSDQITLNNCSSIDAAKAGVNFANKGMGLHINNGTYRNSRNSTLFSVITSNNDTVITNAELLSGIQVTTSESMATSGVTTLNYCNVNEGVNSRSLNVTTGRTLTVNKGSIKGRHVLYPSSTIFFNDVDVTFFKTSQTFNRVLEANNISLYFSGGTIKYEDGASVNQLIDVDMLDFDGVAFSQSSFTRSTTLSATTAHVKNAKGIVILIVNGSANNIFSMKNCSGLLAPLGQNLLSLNNFSGVASILNNDLSGHIAVGAANTLGLLSFQSNTINGTVNIPDTAAAKVLITGNLITTGATLPGHNGESKIVKDNIIG